MILQIEPGDLVIIRYYVGANYLLAVKKREYEVTFYDLRGRVFYPIDITYMKNNVIVIKANRKNV